MQISMNSRQACLAWRGPGQGFRSGLHGEHLSRKKKIFFRLRLKQVGRVGEHWLLADNRAGKGNESRGGDFWPKNPCGKTQVSDVSTVIPCTEWNWGIRSKCSLFPPILTAQRHVLLMLGPKKGKHPSGSFMASTHLICSCDQIMTTEWSRKVKWQAH